MGVGTWRDYNGWRLQALLALQGTKMVATLPLQYRNLQEDSDFPRLHAIFIASTQADGMSETASVDDIRAWCEPSARFDPHQDLLIALAPTPGGQRTEIGFGRVSWYTGRDGIRLYYQDCWLRPEWRLSGVWSAMVAKNERRLRVIAAGHPPAPRRALQAWATASQTAWISALEDQGYRAVRHFHNMLRHLEDIPERPMPHGLDLRPVQPAHYPLIWAAQEEVTAELFERVAEYWTPENFDAWVANPANNPELWQVAWDGEQVAGMVLNRIDHASNQALDRKRGYTEHIFVRKPWRGRGLATALVTRSLRTLKAQGMEEAELGVDAENDSGAFGFYQRLGYRTFSTDIWYRKPIDLERVQA